MPKKRPGYRRGGAPAKVRPFWGAKGLLGHDETRNEHSGPAEAAAICGGRRAAGVCRDDTAELDRRADFRPAAS